MELGRRNFLKASAGAAAGLILFRSTKFGNVAKAAPAESDRAMLVDVTKCIGCWWCYAACKNYNNNPETSRPISEEPPELEADCWSTLFPLKKGDEWSHRKHACMHCTEASCEEVCPTGAISHQGEIVVIDQEWCIGCGYCVQACPFGVPHKDEHLGTARKCTFCIDRINNDQIPACADACPTGAIQYGRRGDLLEVAETQVQALKDAGTLTANLYGKNELGGLHVLYVLDDSPSVYGLPEEPKLATAKVPFQWLSGILMGGLVAVVPFWFIFKRKKKIEAE
ncbi:MAG TPA: 4Fe-4S binding protein [Dehalococcoidia bacterium]|nr:4Fe-4S binding protein [Dehalococcoidia bacterium]